MKIKEVILKPFFCAWVISISISAYADYVKVISVIDGDTIKVLNDKKQQYNVRLANIDAPESNQEYGKKSKQNLNSLIYGKTIYLDGDQYDKYGRRISTIDLGKININKKMVYDGYAWAYRKYLKDNSYVILEEQARKNKKGLWREKNPIQPENWRMQKNNSK